MELKDFGYNDVFENFKINNNLTGFETGRVISEHKERYVVRTALGEVKAEVTGNLRFSAKGREDFPAVGDWVALMVYEPDFAIIHCILPRFSTLKRQAVDRFGEVQIIAANIDYAFLVQSAGRDFNINRLERYLTLCRSSKVKPIILLTKTDLIDKDSAFEITESIKKRIEDVPVLALSNETREGYEAVISCIEKGKTYCMLGSSGVGKSTLINNLSGRSAMRTDAISGSTNKGRHITTHRELILLENGGILIDNPGMREVGIADEGDGLEAVFEKITTLAQNCRYRDCTHTGEAGCAVLEAVENGELDKNRYDNYLKMEKEKAYFEMTVAEKRKRDKDFGKMVKSYKKELKRNKG
jgi:ribosome biogenesis GTPase